MAVRSQEMRNPTMRLARPKNMGLLLRRWGMPTLSVGYISAAIVGALVLYMALSALVGWGISKYDDIRYGTTRTFHTDAIIGIDDSPTNPTHFVAMNINRQVVVMQIPGGDTSKTRIINGPYLFGSNEDRTPVLLTFNDVNGDGLQYMIVNVKNEALIYLNRGDHLGLMNPDERVSVSLD
jgi:hypothetical protein